jgi:glyoxylase-like metal-dependent hydrolase (beta-lactamase superfamily II)
MTDALAHPAYGRLRTVTESASVLLADNPGLMTLEGTNTWVLRAPRSDEVVVVDPGPEDVEHAQRVAEEGRVSLVLISHRHLDHTGGIDQIVELTGAPVRAVDPAHLRADGVALTDGEVSTRPGCGSRCWQRRDTPRTRCRSCSRTRC